MNIKVELLNILKVEVKRKTEVIFAHQNLSNYLMQAKLTHELLALDSLAGFNKNLIFIFVIIGNR